MKVRLNLGYMWVVINLRCTKWGGGRNGGRNPSENLPGAS